MRETLGGAITSVLSALLNTPLCHYVGAVFISALESLFVVRSAARDRLSAISSLYIYLRSS